MDGEKSAQGLAKETLFDRISVVVIICITIFVVLFALFAKDFGVQYATAQPGYMSTLFNQDKVHTIDIQMQDWDTFIAEASEDSYTLCTVVIDGEPVDGVGIRVKGNNSRALVRDYGLERFSFKVELDHFNEAGNYHGLDKFSLDASFQDNSYLKNYMAYDMMSYMGVPSPACSFANITINGQPWGLYLVVEETEEAFLQRNFGKDHGVLYKPDYRYIEDDNSDVALEYIDENPESYDNIFRKALVDISEADKERLIDALYELNHGSDVNSVVMTEELLRYFVVQTYTVNLDGYMGYTGHNYLLYEENGKITMLPWDYNLAFSTYTLGMPNAENDPVKYVNYPIDTPAPGYIMFERPLYHKTMQNSENFQRYYELFDEFIAGYFESGQFESTLYETSNLIAPYVEQDSTKFCSFEDYQIGVEAFRDFCMLRAESVRGQLQGSVPSSFAEQEAGIGAPIDTGDLWLPDMGEVADLK